jgi:hypothetical protein
LLVELLLSMPSQLLPHRHWPQHPASWSCITWTSWYLGARCVCGGREVIGAGSMCHHLLLASMGRPLHAACQDFAALTPPTPLLLLVFAGWSW